ncbi:RHS repeat protein [Geotalea daltonii FRC-32]|uniref:RHS repeat protein n=1 Tax=Geotalea daltonii (strain DSM 22248 / JCM 15807 / FRC-32) TaxID=316067 RepID=B9M6Y7_GEODF|nr:RHS repeat domain-containing protein [Geotalea daltonii]ACM22008.1 RHS repeat protein [Geotalea daltonii FRC-32]
MEILISRNPLLKVEELSAPALLRITDPNGNTTTYTYDNVGRVLTIKTPGDTAVTEYGYTTVGCASCGGTISKIDHIIFPQGNRIDYF